VNRFLIAGVAILIAGFIAFIVGAAVRGQRRRVATGAEALIDKAAMAKTKLNPKGMVLVDGELWKAEVDSGKVEPGEEVTVTKVEGLKLYVTHRKIKGRKS